MSLELAIKVIHEAAELKVHSLKYNYRGEATMNPIFEKVAVLARDMAYQGTFIDRIINSNFNFDINREDIFNGLLAMTKVKVSFDSFKKNVFEKQRRGSNYEKTLANIQKFHDMPERETKLVIQSVRTKLNADEDLETEIKNRFPNATASIRDVVSGRVDNQDIKDMVIKERDPDNRQSCVQAHARLLVSWDGKAQVCCPDIGSKLVVGDCTKEHLKDIWLSERAIAIRKSLLDKTAFEKSPCKNCPSHESYKGYVPPRDS
jgi:radical SAM protein with 4Fe4S-binding SPASM domain